MQTLIKDSYIPIIYVVSENSKAMVPLISALRSEGFIIEMLQNFTDLSRILSKRVSSLVLIDGTSFELSEAREQCRYLKADPEVRNMPFMFIKEGEANNNMLQVGEADLDLIISLDDRLIDISSKIKSVISHFRRNFNPSILKYDNITLDLASYQVRRGKKLVRLGPTEFKILQCLMQYPHKILSRQFLMDAVWGGGRSVESRTIDVHINRLRSALKTTADTSPIIETIRSLGYCLRRS